MQKLLLILLVFILGFNCKKENKVCWECQVTCGSGNRIETICNEGQTPNQVFRDAFGNDCGSFCQKK